MKFFYKGISKWHNNSILTYKVFNIHFFLCLQKKLTWNKEVVLKI